MSFNINTRTELDNLLSRQFINDQLFREKMLSGDQNIIKQAIANLFNGKAPSNVHVNVNQEIPNTLHHVLPVKEQLESDVGPGQIGPRENFHGQLNYHLANDAEFYKAVTSAEDPTDIIANKFNIHWPGHARMKVLEESILPGNIYNYHLNIALPAHDNYFAGHYGLRYLNPYCTATVNTEGTYWEDFDFELGLTYETWLKVVKSPTKKSILPYFTARWHPPKTEKHNIFVAYLAFDGVSPDPKVQLFIRDLFGNSKEVITVESIKSGSFVQLSVRYMKGDLDVFINGKQVETKTIFELEELVDVPHAPAGVWLGMPPFMQQYFLGLNLNFEVIMNETRLWNIIRASDDIIADYPVRVDLTTRPDYRFLVSKMAFYYPVNEGEGLSLHDLSLHNHHANIVVDSGENKGFKWLLDQHQILQKDY